MPTQRGGNGKIETLARQQVKVDTIRLATSRGVIMESLTDPAKIISIMRVMLTELERMMPTAPQVLEDEDSRADQLKGQIDRLDMVLKKHQAANRRKRELEKQNRQNARPTKSR
jgi:hypothetical protein